MQDPYVMKEHIELYKILKFRVYWANTEQDTAIQKLQNWREMYGFLPNKCPAIHTFVKLLNGCILFNIAGADPGEVKWVNFHPPFSELPSFFFFLSLKY